MDAGWGGLRKTTPGFGRPGLARGKNLCLDRALARPVVVGSRQGRIDPTGARG